MSGGCAWGVPVGGYPSSASPGGRGPDRAAWAICGAQGRGRPARGAAGTRRWAASGRVVGRGTGTATRGPGPSPRGAARRGSGRWGGPPALSPPPLRAGPRPPGRRTGGGPCGWRRRSGTARGGHTAPLLVRSQRVRPCGLPGPGRRVTHQDLGRPSCRSRRPGPSRHRRRSHRCRATSRQELERRGARTGRAPHRAAPGSRGTSTAPGRCPVPCSAGGRADVAHGTGVDPRSSGGQPCGTTARGQRA